MKYVFPIQLSRCLSPFLVFATSLAATSIAFSEDRAAEEVVAWNEFALRLSREKPLSPLRESRWMAIQSIAVFDALNSIEGRYESFSTRIQVSDLASSTAAIASASHTSLLHVFPESAEELNQMLSKSLASIPDSDARAKGIALGNASAQAVLALRQQDGAEKVGAYDEENEQQGRWRRTPARNTPPLEPAWGQVQPFVLDSGSQFRPDPPPTISSSQYAADYAEVEEIGSAASSKRTADQTAVAKFWTTTGPQVWNQSIGPLASSRGWDALDTARAYMLLNVAGADSLIGVWDAKYAFSQWRPVTAIPIERTRIGKTNTNWMPLIETPPFPDYPAGHTSFTGAASHVLTVLFGSEPGTFELTSPASGETRMHTRFSDVRIEVENARVWGGAHWRTSCDVGSRLGEDIAKHVLSQSPKPVASK